MIFLSFPFVLCDLMKCYSLRKSSLLQAMSNHFEKHDMIFVTRSKITIHDDHVRFNDLSYTRKKKKERVPRKVFFVP